MKLQSIFLTSVTLFVLVLGCAQNSDETNDSMDNNFTILRGTVPGTLIEAFCENNQYFSTNSIQNGTNKHPFELLILKNSDCRLVMTTNEKSEIEKIITPIRLVSQESDTLAFKSKVDVINLGYIDLALDKTNIIDTNNDSIVDEPLEIKLIDGIIESASVASSSITLFSSSSSSLFSLFSKSSSSELSDTIFSSSFTSITSLSSSSVLLSSSSFSSSVYSSSSEQSASSKASIIYDDYNATSIYDVGDRVVYEGVIYEAKWWTQGETPTDELDTASWKRITPIDGYLEYQNSKIYDVGDRIYYAGILYEAKWWTQYEPPSDVVDGAWKRVVE